MRVYVGVSVAVSMLLCSAPSLAPAQPIVPDGRTATHLTSTGNVTDIHTSTTSGINAFNSFARFNVEAEKVVNLRLPDGADNLLNIVTDERSLIDGTLNSIQNGEVGGNVYFANPHGLVVGADGVINVGALSLSTPTQNYVDTFFHARGRRTRDLTEKRRVDYTDATTEVHGDILAADWILIATAGVVDIGGTIESGRGFVSHDPLFREVVAAPRQEPPVEVVMKNGNPWLLTRSSQDPLWPVADRLNNNEVSGPSSSSVGSSVLVEQEWEGPRWSTEPMLAESVLTRFTIEIDGNVRLREYDGTTMSTTYQVPHSDVVVSSRPRFDVGCGFPDVPTPSEGSVSASSDPPSVSEVRVGSRCLAASGPPVLVSAASNTPDSRDASLDVRDVASADAFLNRTHWDVEPFSFPTRSDLDLLIGPLPAEFELLVRTPLPCDGNDDVRVPSELKPGREFIACRLSSLSHDGGERSRDGAVNLRRTLTDVEP